MRYPNKSVMFLAPEIPSLSATFVYNEIFSFKELVSAVVVVSVHKPEAPAGEDIHQKFGDAIFHLYGRPWSSRILSVVRMLCKKPRHFASATYSLFCDLFSVGLVSRNAVGIVYRFFYAALLAEEMLTRKVHHLHAHFAHVPGDLAMYASIMTGVPYSLVGHANDIYERGWLLKQKAERSAFFATISEFNKRVLVQQGCRPEKIEIVRCGIDQNSFQYRGANKVSQSELRIGSLGRLVQKKGFHTLLEACEKLKMQSVPFILEIAGDGPLIQQLKDQAKSLDTVQDVKFLGAMHHSAVSNWMHSLDVFALACCQDENGDIDGIPVVLMEAMAIGVPVVTTKISGLPELVIHGETGLLAEPEDPEGMSALLTKVASDEQMRESLSRNAKAHVDAEFTLQSNVQKLGDLIFSGKR